jgi:DNA-binding NtrC family response regulator
MYVLVICRDANARRLYVANLVARGYLAVGVGSLAQARPLIAQHQPGVTVLCQLPLAHESEVQAVLSDDVLQETPLVLASIAGQAPDWLSKLKDVNYLSYPPDFVNLAHLVDQVAVGT